MSNITLGCVREMSVKKYCKYAEYGSFECLLFLLICLLVCLFNFHEIKLRIRTHLARKLSDCV